MAKERITVGNTPKSATDLDQSFAGADAKAKEVEELKKGTEINKGGRPIKGRGKATKKVAFHVDEATWEVLEGMMDFPKEKSVNAVCKRIVEAYTEPLQKR